ncbi:MAG: hypothetical protein Q7K42_01175 [Candidatus Diapherotrites archaeon]|nr:hypothetical protein [Candidatus Diapherotrites archaeon]
MFMEFMSLEVLGNLFSGNLEFFVSLVMNNIFLTFGLLSFFVITQEKKANLPRFGVFMLFVWGVFDFAFGNGGTPFSKISMFWYIGLSFATNIFLGGTKWATKASLVIILWYQGFSFLFG